MKTLDLPLQRREVRILIEPILFREGCSLAPHKRQVSWLPGFATSSPSHSFTEQWDSRGCPRFTVAGPRRIRTGFPFNPDRPRKCGDQGTSWR